MQPLDSIAVNAAITDRRRPFVRSRLTDGPYDFGANRLCRQTTERFISHGLRRAYYRL